MTQFNVDFMTEHPLRKKLKKSDWARIEKAINNKNDDASTDEYDAAHDVLFDAIAGKTQTHLGILTLN